MSKRTGNDVSDADDAARFRWLMASEAQVTWTKRRTESKFYCELETRTTWVRRSCLTDAVDAAMATEGA